MRGNQGKYPHVAKLIKSRIVRGVYDDLLPGEDRLARELSVSPGTVRTALAYLEGQGFVRRERRRGTFVLRQDRVSGGGRGAFIRVFLPTYDWSGFAAPVLNALRETAEAYRLSTFLTDIGRTGTGASPEGGVASREGWQGDVLSAAGEPRCVGSVLVSVRVETGDALALADARTPVMVMDWEMPEPILPSVVGDYKGAGELAARHLIQLGHRGIGWMHLGEVSNPNHALRLVGIRETLARVGLKLTREISRNTGEILPGQLESCFAGPDRLTAVICSNPTRLTATVSAIRKAGLRVPEDVSIVGIGPSRDEITPLHPTMVSLDFGTMGKRAVELLLDEDALDNPRREVIPGRLELGSTSAEAPEA